MRGEVYRKIGDKTQAGDCYRTSLKYFTEPNAVAYDRLRELGQSAQSPCATTSQTKKEEPQSKKWWLFRSRRL